MMYETWKYTYFQQLIDLLDVLLDGLEELGLRKGMTRYDLFESFSYFLYNYSSKIFDNTVPKLSERMERMFLLFM